MFSHFYFLSLKKINFDSFILIYIKMYIESKIAHMLFFASVKNGFFDYSTSIKFSLIKFNENKSIELSPSLLEYLCYKIVKNHFLHENFINTDIVLITEKFLSLVNNKNIFKLTNKKYIIILIQDEKKQKWNLIMFPNLKEQINNCFNLKNKKKNCSIYNFFEFK
jgi:hypothetical protein